MLMDPRSLYRSLDQSQRQIRLVTILPSEDDEGQVACQLETVSLDDDPEYAALSYVWGDATITTDILVNDIPFSATTNLVAGLLQFRRTGLGLPNEKKDARLPPLWVDAVCINQQDIAERNKQVALMGDIYTCAHYVLTWLGPPGDRNIDNSIRLIRGFSQALPDRLREKVLDMVSTQFENCEEDDGAEKSDETAVHANTQQRPEGRNGDDTLTKLVQAGLKWISEHPELHATGMEGIKNSAWDSMRGLMRLSYWKRVWIQQERVLCRALEANLIRCGAEVMTFRDMVLFCKFAYTITSRPITPPEIDYIHWRSILGTLNVPIILPVVNMRALWKRGIYLSPVVPLLAKQYHATDPRDMVYGLRSLLNLKVDVDYGKTVREVYLEWHAETLEHFRARGKMEDCQIGMAGRALSEENPHNLPSWLPDLSILNQWRWVHQGTRDDMPGPGGHFQLAVAEGQQYSEDGVLSVYGVVYDRVCRTTLVMSDVLSGRRTNDPFQALKKLAVDYTLEMKARDHPTGLRPLQVLFYTIHQGINPDTREKFGSRLNLRSISAQLFRLWMLNQQTTDPTQDWSHVDLEAAGGIKAYLDSRFRDTTNAHANVDERPQLFQTTDEIPLDDCAEGYDRFMDSLERFLSNKVIFYTADGYIGIGPRGLQIGDQLCVINNCQLPVLLREEGSGHVLVCSVYVYGLSENEPLDMLKLGKVELRKFEIH